MAKPKPARKPASRAQYGSTKPFQRYVPKRASDDDALISYSEPMTRREHE